jgi:phosphoribosylanthranilate isomerase
MTAAGGGAGLFVKICGITREDDARLCVEAGASAIGLNFVPSSKRRVDEAAARRIVDAVAGRVEVVAVIADLPSDEVQRLRASTGIEWMQLHGDEAPAALDALLPRAFKAVRIGDARDVRAAEAFAGERLLVDAKVPGEAGGTGVAFDWSLVTALAARRRLILAGGLAPGNVARAVRAVRPWGVDVASGVESAPGIKDADEVRAFVREARAGAIA